MSRGRQLLASLLSLVVSLAVAELILRRFHPFPDPYARFKTEDRAGTYVPSSHVPDYTLTITPEDGLPGVPDTPVVFRTNDLGFRGGDLRRPKPADEVRVFVVGGSTAECMVLSDAEALHGVLQARLSERRPGRRVRVYNAGKSGDKSYDHVALVTQRLVHLQPDVVVVLAGLNDLRAAVYGADYLHLGGPSAPAFSLGLMAKLAATEFQLPRGLHALLHRRTERERLEELTMRTDYRAKVSLGAGKPSTDAPPPMNLAPYEAHLRTLAAAGAAHGFRLVFVTQASTWNSPDPEAPRWHWLTYLNGLRYREDRLDAALESYNDVMRRLAAAGHGAVFDLSRSVPKSRALFYDDAHFTAAGAQQTGTLLASFLVEKGLVPEAPAAAPGT
jgi:hypothetical protein